LSAVALIEDEMQLQCVQELDDQAELGGWLASLKLADPLPGNACSGRELGLAETQVEATAAGDSRHTVDGVDRGRHLLSAYADMTYMSRYADSNDMSTYVYTWALSAYADKARTLYQ
jgi:hypothetical protein